MNLVNGIGCTVCGGALVFSSLEFENCYIIKSHEEWDRIKHLLDLRPDICEQTIPIKIPFVPTYIKHSTYISHGTLLTYSNNDKKGIFANWIPARLKHMNPP